MQGEENNAANMQLRELQGQRGEFRNCKSPIWDFNLQILVTKKNEKEDDHREITSGPKMCRNFSLFPFLLLLFSSSASLDARMQNTDGVGGNEKIEVGFGRRALLSFKETPRGSNVTFECSRSGPCVACLYSEKNDEKYRCSETGYRIPLKCVEIKDTSTVSKEKKSHNGRSMHEMSYEHKLVIPVPNDASDHASSTVHRNLRDASLSVTDGSQAYITYRSCIPSDNEEKLSVLGFEGIVLCLLLVSGLVVYFRRKRTVSTAGFAAGRVQSNPRF